MLSFFRRNKENQSSFRSAQENLMAPPEVLEKQNAPLSPLKKYGLIGTGVFAVLLILLIITSSGNTPQVEENEVLPSPTPFVTKSTRIETDLQTLEDLLKQAQPAENDLPPPPVDMKVAF